MEQLLFAPWWFTLLVPFKEQRQRLFNGQTEFLITVFKLSREPLLTLAHEFAHLVKNLKSGNFDKHLRPPDDETERTLDSQAIADLAEFQALDRSIAGSER